jgi:hypothetical protein
LSISNGPDVSGLSETDPRISLLEQQFHNTTLELKSSV